MHYCINSLVKNNNGIMQYCIISNDIALIMPDMYHILHSVFYISVQRPFIDTMEMNFCKSKTQTGQGSAL